MNNSILKNLTVKFFFIVITLINILKFESGIYSSNYCYYPHSTNIELVIFSCPSYNLKSSQHIFSLKQNNNEYRTFHCDNIFTHNNYPVFIIHYFVDNYLYNRGIYSPNQHILLILQKKNIWHQSSEEEPPFNNFC